MLRTGTSTHRPAAALVAAAGGDAAVIVLAGRRAIAAAGGQARLYVQRDHQLSAIERAFAVPPSFEAYAPGSTVTALLHRVYDEGEPWALS